MNVEIKWNVIVGARVFHQREAERAAQASADDEWHADDEIAAHPEPAN